MLLDVETMDHHLKWILQLLFFWVCDFVFLVVSSFFWGFFFSFSGLKINLGCQWAIEKWISIVDWLL
jgi:hypothetical protein